VYRRCLNRIAVIVVDHEDLPWQQRVVFDGIFLTFSGSAVWFLLQSMSRSMPASITVKRTRSNGFSCALNWRSPSMFVCRIKVDLLGTVLLAVP